MRSLKLRIGVIVAMIALLSVTSRTVRAEITSASADANAALGTPINEGVYYSFAGAQAYATSVITDTITGLGTSNLTLGHVPPADAASVGVNADRAMLVITNDTGSMLSGITFSVTGATFYAPPGDTVDPGFGTFVQSYDPNTGHPSTGAYTEIAQASPDSSGTVTITFAAPLDYVGDVSPNTGASSFSFYGTLDLSQSGLNGDGSGSFNLGITQNAVVPEPATIIQTAIAGVMGLGFAWRRRKAKNAA